jgi:putative ABC transport system permease protein
MASQWNSIFRFLFRRPEVERELDAELQYHVDRQTELNLQRGMTPAEARRQAVLSVGGIQPLKDDCREARLGRTIEVLFQDIRYGLRVLRKNPGYTFATIVTLALGIGANTAIFSLVYGVFLRPLPYRDGGQLVVLHQRASQAHLDDIGFSPMEVAEYADRNHTLGGVVEHHSMSFTLSGKDSAERVDTSVVSVNFFDVLGVKPILGRTFRSTDTPSSGAVLIMSFPYWQSHHGGDPNIVGKVFEMTGRPTTVIGVLPPIPQFPVESEVYMPTWQCPSRSNPRNIANRKFRLISAVFARLKPGVRPEQAQADLSVIASQIATAHPDVYPPSSGYSLGLDTLKYDLTHDAHTAFLVLLGVAAFVLLVACANVANMMLARLLKLEKEMAVRAALGAGKMRLLRQLLTESVLLSVTGGVLGLAIAPLTLKMLAGFAARFTPRAAEVRLDTPILLFTLLVSLATGILFGLVPALSPWKGAGDSLLHGARTTSGRARQTLRASLVVAQVAVSFVLLIGAGLMIRSFLKLGRENPGFDPVHVLSARVGIPGYRYQTPASRRLVRDNITRKVEAIAAVESVAWASGVPLSPGSLQFGPNNQDFEIEGRPVSKGALAPIVDIMWVDPNYFPTIRQALVKGRNFNAHDDQASIPVVVINQAMARHRWPNEDPIGKRITFDHDTWVTIVGIVGDTREYGLNHPAQDEAYLPADQNGFVSSLVVRAGIDPEAVLPLVRTAIREVDPFLPVDQVATLPRFEYESLAPSRLMTILLAIFAGLAVLISASGIAAVMALNVSQRTHELGVRLALGAPQSAILRLVIRHGLVLAVAGTAAGAAGAVALTRLLSTLLYQTDPTDAAVFLAVSVVFLAVATFACYVPARQVTSIDPLNALRQE